MQPPASASSMVTICRHTELFSDGAARKIEFSLSLKRVDKSLAAIYGDLKTQADNLVTSAGDWLGGLAG
ncbi:hypothetical protein ABF70_23820 [Enterobacter hormaechei subsp. steigerwaltii]|nr:hypothetical protein ABF70_23820 [Enterobacter hormaechei subsp. steigerwaltii]KLQ78113.1 hypothetical protein ABF63_16645 [Enterobacter hormaechei subsp. steigerwaltii]